MGNDEIIKGGERKPLPTTVAVYIADIYKDGFPITSFVFHHQLTPVEFLNSPLK